MSLPVANIPIRYSDERGNYFASLKQYTHLILHIELIQDFLSKFKANQDKDLEQDFANIGIDDDVADPETRSLKYMQQLVRVILSFDASTTRLTAILAKNSESGAANAGDRLGGRTKGVCTSFASQIPSELVYIAPIFLL